MGTTLPFNKSSIVSNGSGRDTYVVMDASSRTGRLRQNSQHAFSKFQGSLLPHCKGHEAWYTQATRSGHWSPPARRGRLQRAASAPLDDGHWATASGSESAGDRSLSRMLRYHRRQLKPLKHLSESTHDFETGDSDAAGARSAWMRSQTAPGEASFQKMLERTAASFRLQRTPVHEAFSFSRSERGLG